MMHVNHLVVTVPESAVIQSVEYFLHGERTGVLLVHGLTGTPSEMRYVAKGLHRAGFTVYAMQLAGHCGTPDDLLSTGWRDWYRSVDEAATRLMRSVDHLFVAGLSMGALLALELAIERLRDVRGVALYGTTFRYDGWAIPAIARLAFLLPFVCSLGIGRGRVFMETFPYGIKEPRIRDRIASSMLAGDSAAGGLAGNPWPSLAQFHLLSRHVRRRLGLVRAPCLALHAAHDDVASARNVDMVCRGVAQPVETVLLHDSYHMITVDRERNVVVDRTARFMRSIAARERALEDAPCA
jgi:carboxylesterase